MGEGFENLKVWQKAHELMLFVHREVVPLLPKEEKWDTETENHLIDARHLEYIPPEIYQKGRDLAGEAQRLLNGYIDYLKRERPGQDEPGIDVNVDRSHVHHADNSSYPDP